MVASNTFDPFKRFDTSAVPQRIEDVRTPFVDMFVNDNRIPLQGAPNENAKPSETNDGAGSELANFMLVDFDYEIKSSIGVGNTVSITILDPGWDAFENMIVETMTQRKEISFQFGWRGQDDKFDRRINGLFVYSYTTTYLPFQGAKVSLIATDKNVLLSQERKVTPFKANERISDVIKKLYRNIDPSIVVEIDPIKQEIGEEHRWMSNLTTLEYIRELLKIASSPTGSSKYISITDVDEQGRTVVRIKADNPHTNVVGQYFVGRERRGEMIEFTPEVMGSLLLSLGGGRADAVSVSGKTGSARRISSVQEEVGFDHGDKRIHKTPDSPAGVHEVPYENIEHTKGVASQYRAMADNHMFSATAVLLGNTSLKPFQQIDVVVLKSSSPGSTQSLSDQSIVHVSGVYIIDTVEHTISAGSFRTLLELRRSAGFIGENENLARLPTSLQSHKTDEILVTPEESGGDD